MAKLDMKTRQKIIERQRAKYRKASKKGKGEILDSICMTTGLSRDRAKKLLAEKKPAHPPSMKNKSGRKPKYGIIVRQALEEIWKLMDYASGKRLCAGIGDMLDALIRSGECTFGKETQRLLREMSPATADRSLERARKDMLIKGKSTTKPGTLLKKAIDNRRGTDWNENKPGFMEIDLVAHCGSTTAGDYVNTLDVTDIHTGWTETRAVLNKARVHVFAALLKIGQQLPFPYRGIDSDNGSEFINFHLKSYCDKEDIIFTRARPYKKNDSCYVEQKNWHVVRRNIGYSRYEGRKAVDAMNEYYALLRLYTNFFMPHMKLASKTKDGDTVRKRYGEPITPYRRLLADGSIAKETKAELTKTFLSLNPVALKRDMVKLHKKLSKMAIPS